MNFVIHHNSPLGKITLASDGVSLNGLWFEGQAYLGSTLTGDEKEKDLPIFEDTRAWLDVYFAGKEPEFTPQLSLLGTPFRKSIWEILLTIPYGQTVTYGEIAKVYAMQKGLNKMSAQAVGGAVAHNPISLIVPCHRVIGSDGSLTGYAGGIERKRRLQELERNYKLLG